MKLLVVVGANHFEEKITEIFEEAKINIYSQANIKGHKDNKDSANLQENWFALSNDYQKSIIFFSFTISHKAERVRELIVDANKNMHSDSRLKAFILPVESYT